MTKVLKKIRETFNIFDDGRKHNPAPQKFQLNAIKNVLMSSMTQERIRLNEAIGYFGHGIRSLSGKIEPSETEVVNVKGKDVVVNVTPAVRTTFAEVDDEGNVTHEQEFLDTEEGRTAARLYEQGHGGFSWALQGRNGHNTEEGSIAKKFFGFDFVNQPNFLAKSREQLMFSSMGEDDKEALLSSLVEMNVEKDRALDLINLISEEGPTEDDLQDILVSHLIAENDQLNEKVAGHDDAMNQIHDEVKAKEQEHESLLSGIKKELADNEALLSNVQKELEESKSSLATAQESITENEVKFESRNSALLSALDSSPFLITEAQKDAFLDIESEGNLEVVQNMFSAMSKTSLDHLPHKRDQETVNTGNHQGDYGGLNLDETLTFQTR